MIAGLSILAVPDMQDAVVASGHHHRRVGSRIGGVHIVLPPGEITKIIAVVGSMHLDALVAAAGKGLLAIANKADGGNLLGKSG